MLESKGGERSGDFKKLHLIQILTALHHVSLSLFLSPLSP